MQIPCYLYLHSFDISTHNYYSYNQLTISTSHFSENVHSSSKAGYPILSRKYDLPMLCCRLPRLARYITTMSQTPVENAIRTKVIVKLSIMRHFRDTDTTSRLLPPCSQQTLKYTTTQACMRTTKPWREACLKKPISD